MLIPLSQYKKGLINLLQDFTEFSKKFNLPCEVVASDNHPYLNKYTLKHPHLIVFKYENFEGVFDYGSRDCTDCETYNMFGIDFQIFFFSFKIDTVNDKPYDTVIDLYGLFSDYIKCNGKSFVLELESDESKIKIQYFLSATTNMLNSGMLNLNSNYTTTCYTCSQSFRSKIKAEKTFKMEENNA